jgi:iron complex transport system permease protein
MKYVIREDLLKQLPATVEPGSCREILSHGTVSQGSILTNSRWVATLGILTLTAIAVGMICLHFGAQPISYGEVLRVLGDMASDRDRTDGTSDIARTILLQVRLPRILLGFLVGCSLASVGVALQALLRNPLADPYVLGVSSGAALGAAVGILFGVGSTFLAETALPACGFAGGLVALVVIYRMAATYGQLPIHSLLLTGVILNAIFSALIMFITSILDPNRSYGMMAWLMGTLTAPTYSSLVGLMIYLSIGLFLLFSQMRWEKNLPARSVSIQSRRSGLFLC